MKSHNNQTNESESGQEPKDFRYYITFDENAPKPFDKWWAIKSDADGDFLAYFNPSYTVKDLSQLMISVFGEKT